MITWICRFLILVFTFNIVAPDLLRAQQVADRAGPYGSYSLRAQQAPSHGEAQPYYFNETNFFKYARNAQEKEDLYVAAMMQLADKYETLDFTSGDEKAAESFGSYMQILHATTGLNRQYQRATSDLSPVRDDEVRATYDNLTHPADAIAPSEPRRNDSAVADRRNKEEAFAQAAFDKFQEIANQEPPTIDGWIEQMESFMRMIDNPGGEIPFNPNNENKKAARYISVYATEALVSALQAAQQYQDPNIQDIILDLLPQATAHVLHALELVQNSDVPLLVQDQLSFLQRYSYRLALFRLDQLYQKMGKPNPIKKFPVTNTQESYTAVPEKVFQEALAKPVILKGPEGKDIFAFDPLDTDHLDQMIQVASFAYIPSNYHIVGYSRNEDFAEVTSFEHIFEDFTSDFYNELKAFAPGSKNSVMPIDAASALMQYAVMYALETDQLTFKGNNDFLPAVLDLFNPECDQQFLNSEEDHLLFDIQGAFFSTILYYFQNNQIPTATVKKIQNLLVTSANNKCASVKILAATTAATLNDLRVPLPEVFNPGSVAGKNFYLKHDLGTEHPVKTQADFSGADKQAVVKNREAQAPYFFTQQQRDSLARNIADVLLNAHAEEQYGTLRVGVFSGYHVEIQRYERLQDALADALDRLAPITAPRMKTVTHPGLDGRPLTEIVEQRDAPPISINFINAGLEKSTKESDQEFNLKNEIYGSWIYSNQKDRQGNRKLAHIYHNNPLDHYLSDLQVLAGTVNLVWEAILWVIGGKIFEYILSGTFKFIRLIRVSASALPSAFKTAKFVSKAQTVRAGMQAQELLIQTDKVMANVAENAPQASKLWGEATQAFKAAEKEVTAAARAAKYGEAAQKSREAAAILAKAGNSADLAAATAGLNNVATKAMQLQRWENAASTAAAASANLKNTLKADTKAQTLLTETENLLTKAGQTGEKADFAAATAKMEETIAYLEKGFGEALSKDQGLAGEFQTSIRALREASNSALTFTRSGIRTFFSAFKKMYNRKIAQFDKWSDLNLAAATTAQKDMQLGRPVVQTSAQTGRIKKVKTGVEYTLHEDGNFIFRKGKPLYQMQSVYDNPKLISFRKPITKLSTEIETADRAVVKLETEYAGKLVPGKGKFYNNAKKFQAHERVITKAVGPRPGVWGSEELAVGISGEAVSAQTRAYLETQQVYARALAKNPETVDWWVSADGGNSYLRVSAKDAQNVLQALQREPEALLSKITSKDGKTTMEILVGPEKKVFGRYSGVAPESHTLTEQVRVAITKPVSKATAKKASVSAAEATEFQNAFIYQADVKTASGFTPDAASAMMEKDVNILNSLLKDTQTAKNFGLIDEDGNITKLTADIMAEQGYMPAGALTKLWWNQPGNLLKSFYQNVKFFAKWKFIYGPAAGWSKDMFLKHLEKEQTEEALKKINDPEWEKTYNALLETGQAEPTDPLSQALAAPKTPKDPVLDMLDREADVFLMPALLGMAGIDKLFGTHLMDMKIYEQMDALKKQLDARKAQENFLVNTHAVMTKKILADGVADYRAVVETPFFYTNGGALPDADKLFAQDLKAIHEELDQWEKDLENLEGSGLEQIEQAEVINKKHNEKADKLTTLYNYKIHFQEQNIEARNFWINNYQDRTSGLEEDIRLIRKLNIYKNAISTVDSWKNSLDTITEEELMQKITELDRQVTPRLNEQHYLDYGLSPAAKQIDQISDTELLKQFNSLSEEKQTALLREALEIAIEGMCLFYQLVIEQAFEELGYPQEAEPFAAKIRQTADSYLRKLENNELPFLRTDLQQALNKIWDEFEEKFYQLAAPKASSAREQAAPSQSQSEDDYEEFYQEGTSPAHSQAY